MTLKIKTAAFACLFSLLIPVIAIGQTDTTEPPQTFELVVDGKAQTVELNKEFELDLKGKTKVKLKALPNRQFEFAGVSFPYPSFFAFEAEHDVTSKLWTLDGNDCVVMVFAFPGESGVGHQELARQIGAQFGRGTKFSKTKFEGKSVSLSGTRIRASVVGSKLIQDVFDIPTESGGSRIIVIQDSLEDDGSHTKEFKNLQKQFKAHLKLTSKSLGYE